MMMVIAIINSEKQKNNDKNNTTNNDRFIKYSSMSIVLLVTAIKIMKIAYIRE